MPYSKGFFSPNKRVCLYGLVAKKCHSCYLKSIKSAATVGSGWDLSRSS